MHKAGSGFCIHQHLHASFNLFIVLACEGFHHDAHRPNHVVADVRTSNAFACRTFEEVWVILAPYETTGVLVNRIVDVHIAQIGQCDKARYIGVVHQKVVAETVYLEGIDGAVFGMVVGSVFS